MKSTNLQVIRKIKEYIQTFGEDGEDFEIFLEETGFEKKQVMECIDRMYGTGKYDNIFVFFGIKQNAK